MGKLGTWYRYGLRPSKNLFKRYDGGWAVVTGATSGMGKQFALQLAGLGFKVGLVGRSPQKVKELADHIQSTYKVETKEVIIDFDAHCTEDFCKEVESKYAVFDEVSVLVNNAGTCYYEPADVMDIGHQVSQVNVNVFS